MSTQNSGQTYYEVLEIAQTAGHHEVVAAYQRAKQAYAPDSPALYTMFTKEEAEDLRKLIEEAFLILGNQAKRKEYDQILLARNNPSTTHNLPDFAPISAQPMRSAHEPLRRNQEAPNLNPPPPTAVISNTVPQGFAKSRLSVYEVKSEIENEILNQTVYDGPFLRKVRQYKNINLEQLSKETRVSRSYLAAMESDDFDALPAPVFLRGFLVQTARILGLDENKVASSYLARLKK
jgi:curved DNA-binding protein CbpA